MSHIIGRGRYARETYPGAQRASAAFARNFALFANLAAPQPVSPGPVTLLWDNGGVNGVESNPVGAPGTVVPITPKVTGRVRVIVTVEVKNQGGSEVEVAVALHAAPPSGPIPPDAVVTNNMEIAGIEVITFVFDYTPMTGTLPVGGTTNLSVLVTTGPTLPGSVNIIAATMDVQELPLATG